MSEEIRVRFAPSPTGYLHVGNARTALYNWLFARRGGGRFLLRIEDTDLERSDARYETQILEDLRWLGLDWDEGPDLGGPFAPYRQSERLAIYQETSRRLLQEGKAYRCFCTTAELEEERQLSAAEHRAPTYSGRCRKIPPEESERRAAAGDSFAIRLAIPDRPLKFHDLVRGDIEFSRDAVSDPILVRSTGIPVYNYVVTVDDALMGITHVIRGDDHLSNTPKQVAIYEAFGWQVPEFAHLSTILGSDKERLSKRHGATSISSFREMGILPEALTNYLALLGWGAEGGKQETFDLTELCKVFTLERVTPSPAVFDWDKLHWLNRHYMKEKSPQDLDKLARPYFVQRNWMPPGDASSPEIDEWFARVLAIFSPAANQLDEIPEKAGMLWSFEPGVAKRNPDNAPWIESEAGQSVLRTLTEKLRAQSPGETVDVVSATDFKAIVNKIKMETGFKGKELFHPIRIALTGTHSGPELDKLIPLMEDGRRLPLPTPIRGVRERLEPFSQTR